MGAGAAEAATPNQGRAAREQRAQRDSAHEDAEDAPSVEVAPAWVVRDMFEAAQARASAPVPHGHERPHALQSRHDEEDDQNRGDRAAPS